MDARKWLDMATTCICSACICCHPGHGAAQGPSKHQPTNFCCAVLHVCLCIGCCYQTRATLLLGPECVAGRARSADSQACKATDHLAAVILCCRVGLIAWILSETLVVPCHWFTLPYTQNCITFMWSGHIYTTLSAHLFSGLQSTGLTSSTCNTKTSLKLCWIGVEDQCQEYEYVEQRQGWEAEQRRLQKELDRHSKQATKVRLAACRIALPCSMSGVVR